MYSIKPVEISTENVENFLVELWVSQITLQLSRSFIPQF